MNCGQRKLNFLCESRILTGAHEPKLTTSKCEIGGFERSILHRKDSGNRIVFVVNETTKPNVFRPLLLTPPQCTMERFVETPFWHSMFTYRLRYHLIWGVTKRVNRYNYFTLSNRLLKCFALLSWLLTVCDVVLRLYTFFASIRHNFLETGCNIYTIFSITALRKALL